MIKTWEKSFCLALLFSSYLTFLKVSPASSQWPDPSRLPSDSEVQIGLNAARNANIRPRRLPESKLLELESLRNAWSVENPEIAAYLGSWSGYEDSLVVYPSSNPNKVCMLQFWVAGRSDNDGVRFMTGIVENNQLISSRNIVGIRESDFLAWIFVTDDRSVNAWKYHSAQPLLPIQELLEYHQTSPSHVSSSKQRSLLEQFERDGCREG